MPEKYKRHISLQIFIYSAAACFFFYAEIGDGIHQLFADSIPDTLAVKPAQGLKKNQVKFKKLLWGKGEKKHKIRVLEMKTGASEYYITALKANGMITGTASVAEMIGNYQDNTGDTVLGAINANYYRGGDNYPIGPLFQNGEVIYLSTIKTWSSAFFDKENRLYVDNFVMAGQITNAAGAKFKVRNVNLRSRPEGIIVYNKFGGEKLSYINEKKSAKLSGSRTGNARPQKRLLNLEDEAPRRKALCRYLNSPAINKDIFLVVDSIIESGSVEFSENSCIISFGSDFKLRNAPKKGDTLALRYNTSSHSDIVFYNGFCGAPRLTRYGKANPETESENLKNEKFIENNIRRTAIGRDRENETIYFVIVESGNGITTTGASLQDMADIMEYLGCYSAINMDGGSSTNMAAYKTGGKKLYRYRGADISACAAIVKKRNQDLALN